MWDTESWILTYCLPSLYFPSLMVYIYFPSSASGYFLPLIYFRNSRLGCLLFHGDILTLLSSPSMPQIPFIVLLTTLPTAIVLLFLFEMDRVTRHLLRVRLLVPYQPVLLDPFELLLGWIRCDKMRRKLWGGITTIGRFSLVDLGGIFFSCLFIIYMSRFRSWYIFD